MGTIYRYWAVIVDPEAAKQICDITGSDNVSVNYNAATLPYLRYLNNSSKRLGSIPTSVCLGTRRYEVKIAEGCMSLEECVGIASIDSTIDVRVSGFCLMPSIYKEIPSVWRVDAAKEQGRLYRYLSSLFRDVTDFKTIMWFYGLAAVDPASTSKFLLLHGPTGTGKSSVVETVSDLFSGCTGIIDTEQLVCKRGSKMPPETARALASNRIITTSELDLSQCELNLHRIKEMTGHDSVSIPPMKVATRCSIISSSNYLPDPAEQPEWLHTAIARRAIILPMEISTDTLPKGERPDSEAECIDFLLACVYEFLSSDAMPISIRTTLYSVLGSWYDTHVKVIEIDPDAARQDVIDANVFIEQSLGMETGSLGTLAYLRSPMSTVRYGGVTFIKGIRHRDEN